MEVYHRLRIFENEIPSSDFPVIISSLSLELNPARNKASVLYAEGDSIFDAENNGYITSWKGLRTNVDMVREYLYGDSDGSDIRTPHMVLLDKNGRPSLESPTVFNLSDSYTISCCGAAFDYINCDDDIMPYGFVRKSYSTFKLALANMLPEIYGPYMKAYRNADVEVIEDAHIPRVGMDICHIGNMHWIDTSKMVACDATTYGSGTYSDSFHVAVTPGQPIVAKSVPHANMSYNDHLDETGGLRWKERRYDALAYGSGSIVLRPVVLENQHEDSYKIFVSCVVSNDSVLGGDYNWNGYLALYKNILWDYVNIQIWDNGTYLSADCIAYYVFGKSNPYIQYKNVSYMENGEFVEDNVATAHARQVIGVMVGNNSRMDIYAVVKSENAVICTTELAQCLNSNTKWGLQDGYLDSFLPGGSRYSFDPTYEGSPDDMGMQYKVYASTEVLYDHAVQYKVGEFTIADEYHYLTSGSPWDVAFDEFKDTSGDKWIQRPTVEMYSGLKWNNIGYTPIPDDTYNMPMYISARGMNVVGFCNTYCVTDSLKQFATIGDGITPIIYWNPQREYQTTTTSYESLEDAINNKKNDNDVVYINDCVTPPKYHILEVIPDNPYGRHCCFDLASVRAKHSSYIGWSSETQNDDPQTYITYDEIPHKLSVKLSDKPYLADILSLHYPTEDSEHGNLVILAFAKFDSRENTSLTTMTSDWHWHYNRILQDEHEIHTEIPRSSNTPSQNSVYYNSPTEIYKWAENTTKVYELVKRDHWYAIVEKHLTDGNSPYAALLDICMPGTDTVCEEFAELLEDSEAMTQRKCERKEGSYIFSINVKSNDGETEVKTFAITDAEFTKYFEISYDSEGLVSEIRLLDKSSLIENHPECTFSPAADMCVDIDKPVEAKYIYNASSPICIPELSGCTFVPC